MSAKSTHCDILDNDLTRQLHWFGGTWRLLLGPNAHRLYWVPLVNPPVFTVPLVCTLLSLLLGDWCETFQQFGLSLLSWGGSGRFVVLGQAGRMGLRRKELKARPGAWSSCGRLPINMWVSFVPRGEGGRCCCGRLSALEHPALSPQSMSRHSEVTRKWQQGVDPKVVEKWLKSDWKVTSSSTVTFEQLLGHFGVNLLESLSSVSTFFGVGGVLGLRSRGGGTEPKNPWIPEIRKNYEKKNKSPTPGCPRKIRKITEKMQKKCCFSAIFAFLRQFFRIFGGQPGVGDSVFFCNFFSYFRDSGVLGPPRDRNSRTESRPQLYYTYRSPWIARNQHLHAHGVADAVSRCGSLSGPQQSPRESGEKTVKKEPNSGVALANQTKKGQFMNFSQGHSGTKVQCESCLFSQGKTPEFTKMGEIHELFVLALCLVWFAGATPDKLWKGRSPGKSPRIRKEILTKVPKSEEEVLRSRRARRGVKSPPNCPKVVRGEC